MAEMVQSSRNFLFLQTLPWLRGEVPTQSYINPQLITVWPRGVGAGQLNSLAGKKNFPKSLPFSTWLLLPRSPTSSTWNRTVGLVHSIQWEN